MTQAPPDEDKRLLCSQAGVNRYQLSSGCWLLQVPAENLGEGERERFLQRIQGLIDYPHPHLLRMHRVFQGDGCFWIEAEAGPRGQLTHSASPRQLGLWAFQLCEVARHLRALDFPLGESFGEAEGLSLEENSLCVLDPGLGAGPEATLNLPSAIQAYGRTLARLSGGRLPPNLQWVASRCEAGRDLRYRDFDEVARALDQTLNVDEPAPVRRLTRGRLPTLRDFQVPRLEIPKKVPKTWMLLALLLPFLLLWGYLALKSSPPAARNFPAAAFVDDQELVFLDLRTGVERQRIRLALPAAAVCRVGNFLYVQCRGSHQLHRLDSRTLEESRGPIIDPDPSQLAADAGGRWMYLLYSDRARALAVRLPNTPQRYLDLEPGACLLQPLELAEGQPGLVVASRERNALNTYGLRSGICERRLSLPGIDCLAAEPAGGLWLGRGQELLELGPNLDVRRSIRLPEPATVLRVVGPRLVCAGPGGLSILEKDELSKISLSEAPLKLEADPRQPDLIWVLSRSRLTCLDLKTSRRIQTWPLRRPPENLILLP